MVDTGVFALREKHLQRIDIRFAQHRNGPRRYFRVGFDQDFARLVIDHFGNGEGALQRFQLDFDFLDAGLHKLVVEAFDDLFPFGNEHALAFGILDVIGRFGPDEIASQASGRAACLPSEW